MFEPHVPRLLRDLGGMIIDPTGQDASSIPRKP
jgi:hypothetical protein